MNAGATAIGTLVARRGPRRVVRIAPAILGGLLDAAAASVLLATGPRPDAAAAGAALLLHVAAALLVAAWGTAPTARRTLAAIAVFAVPCAGAAIAAAALATHGRGSATARHGEDRSPARAPRGTAPRVVPGLPLPDALLDGDEEERLSAIARLVRRGDGEAFALLRCAAAGGDPDRALLASLALDTLGERAERFARPRAALRSRHAAV